MSAFDELMNQTCTIVRNVPARDTFGVVRPNWTKVALNVRCGIQEKQGGARLSRIGKFLEYDLIGYMDCSVDIRPRGDSDQADAVIWQGRTLQVLHVRDESGDGDHWTVYLKRFPGPGVGGSGYASGSG